MTEIDDSIARRQREMAAGISRCFRPLGRLAGRGCGYACAGSAAG